MPNEMVDVIDDKGQVLEVKLKSQVAVGDKLRYVQVFLFDADGQLLVQQRQEGRKRANLLDASVAGHVQSEESFEDAALRELEEELSITTTLEPVGDFYGDWGHCRLFKGVVENDIQPCDREIKNILRWKMMEVFHKKATLPWAFSEGFLSSLNFYAKQFFAPLTYVDGNDNVLGTINYEEMNRKRLPVRVIHVYIQNSKGEYLFQQRGPFVEAPYRLDEAATGHVDLGESYEEAATRELYEELGIEHTFTKDDEIFHGQLPNNKFAKCYLLKTDNKLEINGDEVIDIAWLTLEEAAAMMKKAPFLFTDSSLYLHKKCYDQLK